ncbi:MAG: transketolase [Prolixibacteraceae bacterium]|jgi:transketolase|nr:transketolase [Prolixibacteraceae bacterium]MDI9565022.1 transketolase [Bacteroidota bacterium]NLT00465.1 transketolase [Bacteroidales bacterium]OQB81025.1 MAG: Transketolase [Bacteroidetes bacterium ADurb.Bin123]HNZ68862.1 transketolase [Prolixibacteraceae bacterium]
MGETIASKSADNIRILAAAMVEKARSGHPGGAMGGADFIHILYSEFLNYDPEDMDWKNRDRFFLDPGHMSPMLYAVLSLAGFYTMNDLKSFRQWGSTTPGHPEVDVLRGVENTSGPLGQGHVMAVGAAIAERFLVARFGEWMAHKTYTFISDGGVQEEISQGAGRIAGHLGLHNLIMFYDSNDIQLSTKTTEVTSEETAKKYEAWGWNVMTINGNSAEEIRAALKKAHQEKEKPTLIIGRTIMGKGAVKEDGSSFEMQISTHGMPLGDAGASFSRTIINLGGNPENPFVIFEDVAEKYAGRKKELLSQARKRKKEEQEWATRNPDLAAKLKLFFSGKAPDFDFAGVVQKDHQATRAASSAVLAAFAGKIENLVVASADLSNSDKTDGFLKKTTAFKKGDFSGSFLQAGVAELTMACLMNGMALHGGVIPVCGTFFVFSDYMKPAVRLAALMELPVKYVWTHDAFRVGEDGPTHQPVEQEAQIRLMEKLQNHKGHNSMLVLRPADVHETTAAWKLALENTTSPTALILSRQNITNLPGKGFETALQAARGAYIVEDDGGTPDIVLLASGSEVATLIEGAALLRQRKQLKARVVSVPSEGLFRNQNPEYQRSVLPCKIPRFGMTAGLSVTLAGLVGENGAVWGMNSFGYSAPYKVLDEKLGFNGENVYQQVIKLLGKE